MEDFNYEVAQAYYDSALVHMPEENERREEVGDLASNLTDIGNLRMIGSKTVCWSYVQWTRYLERDLLKKLGRYG